jgi:hypothetical protein
MDLPSSNREVKGVFRMRTSTRRRSSEAMSWWRVKGELPITVYTDVLASTADEAHRIAFEEGRPVQTLCYQCDAGSPTQEWTVFGGLDGEPMAMECSPPTELESEEP